MLQGGSPILRTAHSAVWVQVQKQLRGPVRTLHASKPARGLFDGLKDQWNQSKGEYMGKKEQEIFQVL